MKNDMKSTSKDSKSKYIPESRIKSKDYPFNRELAIRHPIHGNAMTHDEVVGGGHTIDVLQGEGSQFSDFVFGKSGSEPPVTSKNKAENGNAVPNYDGTVGGADKAGATPNYEGTVGGAAKKRTSGNKNSDGSQNEKQDKNGDKADKLRLEPLRDNFGQVPPLVNSVYGNTDISRHTYGDFGENAVESKNGNRFDEDKQGGVSGSSGNERDDSDSESKSKKNADKDTEKDRAVTVKSGKKLIKTIVIAGQIEGHTQLPQEQKATRYEELIPQLIEIEENDEIGGLLLILNTVGGDVEAGLALSELIAGMKKPTASLVLGGGHSIGVPLAVSAKRSFIVPSATMTLHPVRVTGLVLSAPQTYVYLNNMQERIINFVCSHSGIAHERFRALMLAREEMSTDLGSVLDGKKAVDEGLIDALGTLGDAMEYLTKYKR